MEESVIKDKIILILTMLSVILFIGLLGSWNNARVQKAARDKEMAKRLDVEERADKCAEQTRSLRDKLDKELSEEKSAHETTKKALTQEQLVNKSIKEELGKLNKLKEALEEDLREALITGKSGKAKR